MGYNQGVKRLSRGIVRSLAPHEVKRGYIFISTDRNLSEILDTKDFELEVGAELCRSRRIDALGRVQVPRGVMRAIGTGQKLRIGLVSRKRLRIELLG